VNVYRCFVKTFITRLLLPPGTYTPNTMDLYDVFKGHMWPVMEYRFTDANS